MARAGKTKITSISTSEEFDYLMKKYHLSPTEVFRVGMAVTLCEMGIKEYDNTLNQDRMESIRDLFIHSDAEEKLNKIKEILGL